MKRKWLTYGLVAILLVLVLGLGVAVGRKLSTTPVRAAPLSSPAVFTCTPNLVVSANVRVVVRCATGYSGNPAIVWFAYPTTDSAGASRMLSVFETAKATGSTVTLYFDDADLSGAAYGCQTNDCRAIWAVTTP